MGRKSKADKRRNQIIEAFFLCVVDEGLANASIRKIAARAGVQPSVLHHYFDGKEEIVEEAVIWFTDRIFEAFREQMAEAGQDIPEQVDRGMAFIFSKGMINEDHTGFFLECCVAARHNQRVKETLADLFSRFRAGIVAHLGQVPGFSELSEENQDLLSATIVALHEGIELQWFADPDQIRLDRALETCRQVIAFFIQKGRGSL